MPSRLPRAVLLLAPLVGRVAAGETSGCCFSIGYGYEMEPCCLKVDSIHGDAAFCRTGQRIGGATGFNSGACPTTAAEAASMIAAGGDSTPTHALASDTQDGARYDGCCFAIGFGAEMKPCCLEAKPVANKGACKAHQRMGGATGYVVGHCPTSAEEAAQVMHEHVQESSDDAPAVVAVAATSSRSEPEDSDEVCCFEFGYGAMMKPCCLKTRMVATAADCGDHGPRIGGAEGYSLGVCPSTAVEAKEWLDEGVHHAKPVTAAAEASNAARTEGQKTVPAVVIFCVVVFAACLLVAILFASRHQRNHTERGWSRLDGD